MSALAVHELPVIERARMIREARALEEAAVKDKTYQTTTLMGPDIRYWLQTLQFQGSPATTIATYELPWAWLAVEYADYRMADFCTGEGVPILRDFLTRHWGDAAVDTRRNRLYALRSGFQWGVDERDLPWNPAGRIKPPKAGETLRAGSKGCYLSTLELHELDEACSPFLSAFGEHPYLVGSASQRPDFRDVDVRLILADDEFDALFAERKGLWALMSRLGATYLRSKTGLPIDFQIQRQSEANDKFGNLAATPRNPLGSRSPLDFAGGGDAT